MGVLSKIFGIDSESEKNNKFKKNDRQSVGGFERANLAKAQWLVNRGNDFRQHNQLDQAIEDFRDAIKLYPNHILAHISWGVVLYKKGMLKEAVDVLEKGIKGSNGFNDYYFHELLFALGSIYMEIGNKKGPLIILKNR